MYILFKKKKKLINYTVLRSAHVDSPAHTDFACFHPACTMCNLHSVLLAFHQDSGLIYVTA